MKVLFVDDEPLIRKGLRAIISWSSYDFTEFYEAESATEGLEIIQSVNPELVILDICMEDTSGLTLAQTARENGYAGRMIILSGYSDFEYAKSAFYSDVTAYLVKPVDPDELTIAVTKAIDELYKESIVSIFSDQSVKLSRKNLLENLLTGKMTYTSEMETTYHISLHSDYYRLVSLYCAKNKEKSPVTETFLHDLTKSYTATAISETEYAFILTSRSELHSFLNGLQKFMRDYESPNLIALISSEATVHTDLSMLYDQNKGIMNNIYYYKSENEYLIQADMLTKQLSDIPDDKFDFIRFTNELIQYVVLLQNENIDAATNSLYHYLILQKQPKDSIGFLLVNCYAQILQELCINYPQLELELPTKEQFIAHLYTMDYLCEEISYLNLQLMHATNFIHDASQPATCERICQYIKLNYATPLKLETIANKFHYNSAYLGKLFLKETGDYFNTYVDKVRIENAKCILAKGASVQQTCEACGYSNVDYFTKKFKKYTGMLPSEYKKNGNHS